MKKLMIAAAAAAMVGGAYATEGCCDDATTQDPTCNAYVYSLTITVKGPVATKSVKKNGCTGLYLDNGSRTVNGYMWTCCNPCEDTTNGENWQITLWDKTAKTALLFGVSNSGADVNEWTASYSFVKAGLGEITIVSDKKTSQVAARADLNTKVAAEDPLHVIVDANVEFEKTTTKGKTQWVDYTLGNSADSFRFGKAAGSYVAWGKLPVTAANLDGSFDQNYGCLDDGTLGAFGASQFTGLDFVMTGSWKAKEYRPNSLSGNVIGEMVTISNCGEFGDWTWECNDFETWCDYAWDTQRLAPVTGTIKASYVNKLKASLYNTVPAYDRN